MSLAVPTDYAGLPFTEPLLSLLSILDRYSFSLAASGSSKKTVRVFRSGENLGYVNDTVIKRGGAIGYHFAKHGRKADACPEQLKARLVPYFCKYYGCEPSDLLVHKGSGSNEGRTYLILRNPQVALRILLTDAGQVIDPSVQIVEIKERYIEERIVDVVMQRRERSEAARSACLAAYGFSCFVCGANLKSRYAGVPVEVIHVHHEEPLSGSSGEREFDPVATMKPICPNCRAVIHTRNPPYTVQEVRRMLGST